MSQTISIPGPFSPTLSSAYSSSFVPSSATPSASSSSTPTSWQNTNWGSFLIWLAFLVPFLLCGCCCIGTWSKCRSRRRRNRVVLPVYQPPMVMNFPVALPAVPPPAYPGIARRNTTQSTHVAFVDGTPESAEAYSMSCKVCFVSMQASSFPSRTPTKLCLHKVEVCSSCLARHIDSSLQRRNKVPFCPMCYKGLTFHDIQEFSGSDVFDRYDRLLTRKFLSTAPSFVWCKNVACSGGQYHEPSSDRECDGALVTCFECGSKSCFNHDIPWHDGMTCREYDKSKEHKGERIEAGRSKRTIERNTRACPKCGTPVQKNGGCNNMYCAPPGGCGHNFRWLDAKHTKLPKAPKL